MSSKSSSSNEDTDPTTSAAEKSDSRVRFEDILQYVGNNGKWQIVIFLFTWIEGVLIGCHHLSSSFIGASMDHWCNTDNMDKIKFKPWTLEQKRQFAIPLEGKKYSTCEMYNLSSIGSLITDDFEMELKKLERNKPALVSCDSMGFALNETYQYDDTEGILSIVNDWNLVCDRLPLLSTVQGSYMAGVFVGCVVFGWASDRFGRRPAMLVAAGIQMISGIVAAFSVNYIMLVFFRFLVAFSVSGVFECGFVLVTEICGLNYRATYGILTQVPFGIGAALLPLIAYVIRDWTSLQLAISVPCVVLASYYWFVPESPRWLMSQGRLDEALEILKKGAVANGNRMPSDEELMAMMERLKKQEEEDHPKIEKENKTFKEKIYSIFEELIVLVETKEMRRRTLNIFYSWFVVAMVYYGLSFNSKNLGGSRYVNMFISGFVEIPAVIMILPLLGKLGRSKCYCGTFIGGGLACAFVALITIFVNEGELVWLTVSIAMVGKFLVSSTFAISYLYTAELFPTKVRNIAVGTASTFARIGAIGAPYIVDLLGSQHPSIPAFIFGFFAVSAGLLALLLPETLNRKMPETVAEIEKFNAKKDSGNEGQELNAVISQTDAAKADA